MNKIRLVLCTILTGMLATSLLVGCSACGSREPVDDSEFTYSKYLDDNGRWEGITATDYVTLFDYDALEIPADVHEVSDEEVQTEVDSIVGGFATTEEVTGRAVQDGDTLNIDYVGSIDGVEFEGGSTGGEGTEVIVGTTSYIDDFIEQLIGHNTGDVFDIEVTFPEDYEDTTVAGKDAIFNITINSIAETVTPELTDEFVATNLTDGYGWTTIDEMYDGLAEDLQNNAILSYVQEQLTEVEVSTIPEEILNYQEGATVAQYESYAEMYGVELDEFLASYVGVENVEALLEQSQENIRKGAVYSLAVQAIAEEMGLEITDEDLAAYFEEYFDDADYSSYEEEYGLPYLKQTAMSQTVLDHIVENAKLA